MRIVHLSDLHFGALELGRPQALCQAVKAAAPDMIVVSGDLTQHGRLEEFEEARDFLRELPQPFFVVPGNHDMPHGLHLWARFRHTFAAYQTMIQKDLEPVWRGDSVIIVGVNSAVPGGWYLDWDRGRIKARHLIHVRQAFHEAPEDWLRVLVVHHPPASPPGGTKRHLVDNRTALFGALNEAGVDLILSGHFHLSYAMPVHLPGTLDRCCVLSVTSTATSSRLKGEPNGFHVIDHEGLNLQVQAFRWEGADYAPATMWRFQRSRNRDWNEEKISRTTEAKIPSF